jgi:hypothetical protein
MKLQESTHANPRSAHRVPIHSSGLIESSVRLHPPFYDISFRNPPSSSAPAFLSVCQPFSMGPEAIRVSPPRMETFCVEVPVFLSIKSLQFISLFMSVTLFIYVRERDHHVGAFRRFVAPHQSSERHLRTLAEARQTHRGGHRPLPLPRSGCQPRRSQATIVHRLR